MKLQIIILEKRKYIQYSDIVQVIMQTHNLQEECFSPRRHIKWNLMDQGIKIQIKKEKKKVQRFKALSLVLEDMSIKVTEA